MNNTIFKGRPTRHYRVDVIENRFIDVRLATPSSLSRLSSLAILSDCPRLPPVNASGGTAPPAFLSFANTNYRYPRFFFFFSFFFFFFFFLLPGIPPILITCACRQLRIADRNERPNNSSHLFLNSLVRYRWIEMIEK